MTFRYFFNLLTGRIISIETQKTKTFDSQTFNPDITSWPERGNVTKSYIFVIKIFYEVMNGSTEEIGNLYN